MYVYGAFKGNLIYFVITIISLYPIKLERGSSVFCSGEGVLSNDLGT